MFNLQLNRLKDDKEIMWNRVDLEVKQVYGWKYLEFQFFELERVVDILCCMMIFVIDVFEDVVILENLRI